MVDFKAKIKAQKSKDRKRADKKAKTPEKHRLPSVAKAPIPSAIQRKDNSAALTKGVTDLFKDKDIPTGSEVQELEDYVSGYGNPIGAGPADVSFGPLYEGAGYSVFKKGGRLKNADKRKRAALRGQRSELRGS